jgi:hypothetical protein
MTTPNPTCKSECRFTTSFSMTTAAYYPPIYDKHGVNTNPDRNTTTATIYCSVCSRSWNGTTYFADGEHRTKYKEIL